MHEYALCICMVYAYLREYMRHVGRLAKCNCMSLITIVVSVSGTLLRVIVFRMRMGNHIAPFAHIAIKFVSPTRIS